MPFERHAVSPGWLGTIALVVLGCAVGARACFPQGDTSALVCCGEGRLEIDTGPVGTGIPAPTIRWISSTGTFTATGTALAGGRGRAFFNFTTIVLSENQQIVVAGNRSLHLLSQDGIMLDSVTIDGSPPVVSATTNAPGHLCCCCGSTTVTLNTYRTGVLGGYWGGRAVRFPHEADDGFPGESPSGVSAAQGRVKSKDVSGVGAGSFGGVGGKTGPRNSGATYGAFDMVLQGGGGGGGGGNEDYAAPAYGGAGGGGIEFELVAGNLVIGPTVYIRMDGGDAPDYAVSGGAGAGGMIRFTLPAGSSATIMQGARLHARGGWVPNGQNAGGGGWIIFRRRTGSGSAPVSLSYDPSSLSVRSGMVRCTASCATTTATDGVIVIESGAYSLDTNLLTLPTSISQFRPNPSRLCLHGELFITSASKGNGLQAPSCCWSPGDRLSLFLALPALASPRFDARVAPNVTFAGVIRCSNPQWMSWRGFSVSLGRSGTVECTIPGGGGASLDLAVSYLDRGVVRNTTLSNALSYPVPSVTGWSGPALARRWTNTSGPPGIAYSINLEGEHLSAPGLSHLVTASVGGRPCTSVAVINHTFVACSVPVGTGSSRALTLAVSGRSAGAVPTTFSYAPPEIHRIMFSEAHNASSGRFYATTGDETLEIRGLNFGAEAADVTVSVDGRPCTAITLVNDRRLRCTTPPGGGQNLLVSVAVSGQTATSLTTSDSRSILASIEANNDWNNQGTSGSWQAPPTFSFSLPSLFTATAQGVEVGLNSSEILRIRPTGSETVSLRGIAFGSGLPAPTVPPVLFCGVAQDASRVTRIDDTLMTVRLPAGVGAGCQLTVGTSPLGFVRIGYAPPVLTSGTRMSFNDLRQSGGEIVSIFGSNFAPVSVLPAIRMWIGPSECLNVTHVGDDRVDCATPPGTGWGHTVQVEVGGQNSSSTGIQYGYGRPVVSSVVPAYEFNTSAYNVSLLIQGSFLGGMPSHVTRVQIGGVDCPRVEWISTSSVRCNDIRTFLVTGRDIVVETGSLASLPASLLTIVPRPDFREDFGFTSGPTEGNSTLALRAIDRSFGFIASDILSVQVGPYTCVDVQLASDRLSCTVQGGVGRDHSVVVTTRGGLFNSPNRIFSFLPPTVTSVFPSVVQGRAEPYDFLIRGTNFGNVAEKPTSISISGQPCNMGTLEWYNSTTMLCRGVPGLGPWTPSITVVVGGQEGTGNVLSVAGSPTISTIVPAEGPTEGNFVITITGSSFGEETCNVTSVTIGGEECLGIVCLSRQQLNCTVQPGVGRALSVIVDASNGVAFADRAFSFFPPTVTRISPNTVLTGALWYNFTIEGTNLGNLAGDVPLPSDVVVGGNPCASVQLVNSSFLRCVNVPATLGWTSPNVIVQLGGQQGIGAGMVTAFGRPDVFAVQPLTGRTVGGFRVNVSGENFGSQAADVGSVTIGGRECTDLVLLSDKRLQCTVPPGVGGENPVVVTNRGGLVSTTNPSFGYEAPIVTGVAPNEVLTGSLSYTFVILGDNFGNTLDLPSGASVGGNPCVSVERLNSTALRCLNVSAQSSWQGTGVSVTVGGQEGFGTNLLAFMSFPIVTGVLPSSGDVTGGSTVTISGLNFGFRVADVRTVTFNGRACQSLALQSSRQLTCLVPAGVGGSVSVVLETAGGLLSPSSPLYSYLPPTIARVTPAYVLTGNVTYDVLLTGTNLGGPGPDLPSQILVGGVPCGPDVILFNATALLCRGMSGLAGWTSRDVSLTVGGQTGTGVNLLETFGVPRVITVTPSVVPQVGGTRLAILCNDIGRSMADIREVRIGPNLCLNVSMPSFGRLECNAPPGVGVGLDVTVVNSGSVANAEPGGNRLFSYETPVLQRMSPSYALSGPLANDSFVIEGAHLGLSRADIDEIVIGGVRCNDVVFFNNSAIGCRAMIASNWVSPQVSVTIRGSMISSSTLFSYFLEPRVRSVSPTESPTSGFIDGSEDPLRLTVTCEGCGRAPSDVSAVLIGDAPCGGAVFDPAAGEIYCNAPPGTGRSIAVRVRTRTGKLSGENALFSYRAPSVESIVPADLFTGSISYDVLIRGNDFGSSEVDLSSVRVGGSACGSVVLLNRTALLCQLVAPPWTSSNVEVVVNGQANRPASLVRIVNRPDVLRIDPVSGPVDRFTNVTLTGDRFGFSNADITRVVIGPYEAESVTLVDERTLVCLVPPGVGASNVVTVHRRDGEASAGVRVTFSYHAPAVSSVVPSILLSGSVTYPTVDIVGSNFGNAVEDLASLTVAGGACADIEFVSSSHLRCLNLTSPFIGTAIDVSVGNQRTTTSGLVQVLPRPEVIRVSPANGGVDGGYWVTVEGSHFGASRADVTMVTFGSFPSTNISFVSAASLSVQVPRGSGTALAVVVHRRDDMSAVSRAVFSFDEPDLLRVEPPYSLSESGVGTFFVIGTNLAPNAEAVDSVTIGGVACGAVIVRNSSVIECAALPRSVWEAQGVDVRYADGRVKSSRDLFVGYNRPEVRQVDPQEVSTRGGVNVTLLGSSFGHRASDIARITFGGSPATAFWFSSPTLVVATVPPGISADVDVILSTRVGVDSVPQRRIFGYAAPLVEEIEPSYAFTEEANVRLVVRGRNFGNQPSDIASVRVVTGIGASEVAVPCALESWTSPELFSCIASMAGLAASQAVLVVRVGNQDSKQARGDLLQLIGPPLVLFLQPSTGRTRGDNLTIAIGGTNFGRQPADVLGVTIGGTPVPWITFVSDTELRVGLPPGVGAQLPVVVTTRGLQRNRVSSAFSYEPADVRVLEPPYSLTGQVVSDFRIRGENFGNRLEDIDYALVGDRRCESVVWVSPEELECFGVNGASWSSKRVVVNVGGQNSTANALFEPVGQPVIETVSPRTAKVGESILILGSNFGYKRSDILTVEIDGVPCQSFENRSSSALLCVVPEPSPSRKAAALLDRTELSGLSLIVRTAGGLANPANRWFAYTGSGSAPYNAPVDVVGWRDIGIATTVQLQWSYTDIAPPDSGITQEERDFMEPATAFVVEISNAFGTNGSQVILRDSLTPTNVPGAEGLQMFKHTLVGFERIPYRFRVQAQNSVGRGPLSAISDSVTETCTQDEFLQTFLPVSNITCAPCPVGAFCGGLNAENVTARSGYWRVPWSPHQLGFAPCPAEASCAGWGSDGLDRVTVSGANSSASFNQSDSSRQARRLEGARMLRSADFRPRPLPTLVLLPDEHEGCLDGHGGVLCSKCGSGFARSGSFTCRQCPPRAASGILFLLVIIAIFAAVGFVIRRTLRAKGKESKPEVMVLKVLFTHMQTISIASTFELTWSSSANSFFSFITSVSSVSGNALSLECLADETMTTGGSAFYTVTLVVLASPMVIIAAVSGFWMLRYLCISRKMDQAILTSTRSFGASSSKLFQRSSAGPMTASPVKVTAPAKEAPSLQAEETGATVASPEADHERKSATWSHTLQRISVSVIVALFLIHATVTKAALQLFTCVEVKGSVPVDATAGSISSAAPRTDVALRQDVSKTVLVYDMEIECDSSVARRFTYGVGLPFFILYSLGIPLVAVYTLYRVRDRLEDDDIRRLYGFLYSGFREKFYFWEGVVMLRKVIIAVFSVFLAPMGAEVQTYCALLLVFHAAILHARAWPYTRRALNYLELGSLVVAHFTFFGGLFLMGEPESSRIAEFVSSLIILTNVLFVLWALVFIAVSTFCPPREGEQWSTAFTPFVPLWLCGRRSSVAKLSRRTSTHPSLSLMNPLRAVARPQDGDRSKPEASNGDAPESPAHEGRAARSASRAGRVVAGKASLSDGQARVGSSPMRVVDTR